jgi:hypothetical protein
MGARYDAARRNDIDILSIVPNMIMDEWVAPPQPGGHLEANP